MVKPTQPAPMASTPFPPHVSLVRAILIMGVWLIMRVKQHGFWPPLPHVSSPSCWLWVKRGWTAEMRSWRQSCLLMTCKVISCGLVKLKAASLGCNSWWSCPPFTRPNPSFGLSLRDSWKEARGAGGSDDAKKDGNEPRDEKKFSCQMKQRWYLGALWVWISQTKH